MEVKSFFDSQTSTITHLIIDQKSKNCAVIDSVLNYDHSSGHITTESADDLISHINNQKLQLQWLLETHIHADHLSAANYLREKLGGKIAISKKIIDVVNYWAPLFNNADPATLTALHFDHLFSDNEIFQIGELKAKIIYTQGHTQSCSSFIIEDAIFVGDLIFMPSIGTGRADFPGGDAKKMYHSIQKIFSFPDHFRIFTGHDYPAQDGEPQWQSTVAEQKRNNILAKINDEKEYVKIRKERDQNKSAPKLLFPAIQFNIRAGKFPKKENNNIAYIKIPINLNLN